MNLIKTNIDDLYIIKPSIFKDNRGYFFESFNKIIYDNNFNKVRFVQDNISKSIKGTVRGLHFQNPPHAQSKLISCLKGEILDVSIDLRSSSETFGHINKTIINDKNNLQLFIPKGFAHGFSVLSDDAIISYKVDNYYNSKYENGIIWNDKNLNIDWGINIDNVIISKKDTKWNSFDKILNPF
jgi:dTDP-4-dehydrorhamnose 3,5-epimerase